MMDIVAIGELLIDFTPFSCGREQGLKPHAGGAPCNVLAMAQQMGSRTAFIGKVGNDWFGSMLQETIEGFGIDSRGLIKSDRFNTTLAFVHLTEGGERSFTFYRRHGADLQLRAEEIDRDLLREAGIIHFGSLSFTDEPARSAVLKALESARDQGKVISYDPNYRPALWESEEAACRGMRLGLPYADILKVSLEEGQLLTGETAFDRICDSFFEQGLSIVCLTLGEMGTYIATRRQRETVPGFSTVPVDTTGAGDSFMGCFLHQVAACGVKPEEIPFERLVQFVERANAAASLCIESPGGMPAMPAREAVEKRLRNRELRG